MQAFIQAARTLLPGIRQGLGTLTGQIGNFSRATFQSRSARIGVAGIATTGLCIATIPRAVDFFYPSDDSQDNNLGVSSGMGESMFIDQFSNYKPL